MKNFAIIALCVLCMAPHAYGAQPSSDDMALAAGFDQAHFADSPGSPQPFSFVYDGRTSTEFLKGWQTSVTEQDLNRQRSQRTVIFTDPKTGLQVRCVITRYSDFPAIEWVLHFKNTGTVDTPILENIQPLDLSLPTAPGDCRLHYAEGSHALITDFRPLEKALAPGDRLPLASFGGRSSDGYLPFFNLALPGGGGVISAVGWTAQWAAEFSRDTENVHLKSSMERTHLTLHPGEEIRSPAILLLFYSGTDHARSQNLFRAFMLQHCTRGPIAGPDGPPVAVSPHAEIAFEGTTEANTLAIIDRITAQKLPVDCWWIDAGWYDCQKNWARWVGTWEPNRERFPNGLKPMADAAHAKGLRFLLWFEPERVMPDTWLHKNHPDWLLAPPPAESFPPELRYQTNDGFHLLNLGNPDALAWAKQHFGKMITDLGINIYRNDFNMYPSYYWRNGEAEDRQGINEIRYVTALYDYFDTLAREHPGLLLDNCASGGRRIDFEMLRRSLVLTRSDYLWDPVGQQCHTYGLAQWIPLTGIGAASTQPYECRSGMGAHYALAINTAASTPAEWDSVRSFLTKFQTVRQAFQGDFYTLTPYSTEQTAWLAFQFDKPDLEQGIVQVFRRAECTDSAKTIRLQGLDPAKTYEVSDWDKDTSHTLAGSELLEKGIVVDIKDKPGAAVLTYRIVGR